MALLVVKSIKNHANHTISGYLPLMGKNNSMTTGNIYLLVSVLSPGDVVRIEDETGMEKQGLDETFDAAIIKSGNAEQHGVPYHLFISLYRIEFAGDTSYDLFTTCEFAGCTLRSTTKHKTNTATLNEGFKIPLTTPLMEDAIIIGVWDERPSPPKLLARGSISFLSISTKPLPARWFNLYGFSPKESASFTSLDWELISKSNVEGTAFLGRIMIGGHVQKLRSYAPLGTAELIIARAQADPSLSVVTYFAEVYEAEVSTRKVKESRYNPPALQDIYVQITSGTQAVRSPAISPSAEKNDIRRYSFRLHEETGSLPPLTQQLFGDDKYHPDVFVEVYTGTTRIGYRRFPAKTIPQLSDDLQTCPPMWIPLRNPYSFYNDSLPLNLLISLTKGWGEGIARSKRRRVVAAGYVLRCYLYAARYLPFIEDGNETIPSPRVEVSCTGASDVSRVAHETRFPVWLQTLEIPCRLMIDAHDGVPTLCPIIVEVKHRDKCLGCTIAGYTRLVGKRQAHLGDVDRVEPSWIELTTPEGLNSKLSQGGDKPPRTVGHILLAVEVLRKQDAPLVPPQNLVPNLVPATVRLSLMALRNMLPPLKKDFPLLALSNSTLKQVVAASEVSNPVVEFRLPNYEMTGNDHVVAVPWLPYADIPMEGDEQTSHKYLKNATWRESEFISSFNFHFVSGVQVSLPAIPLMDPHLVLRVFDGSTGVFLGESAIPLFEHLPWFQPSRSKNLYAKVRERLTAKSSFQENPNLTILKEAYSITMSTMRRESLEHNLNDHSAVSNRTLPVKALQEAQLHEMSSLSTMASSTELLDSSEHQKEVALEDGVPIITKVADQELAASGYNTRPFHARTKIPSIWMPAAYMVFLEGKSRSKITAELKREVVEGGIEGHLTDTYWPSRILWRPHPMNPFDHLKGGAIKAELAVTAIVKDEKVTQASVPNSLLKTAFSNKRFRKTYRSNTLMEMLRVRVYILRIAAMSLPVTITRDGDCYPYPYPANSMVEVQIQISEKRADRFMSKSEGPNPRFAVLHEIDVRVPEESIITISAWVIPQATGMFSLAATAPIFAGQTRFDILDRFYSETYRDQVEALQAPLEIRPLRLFDTSPICTGSLEMLVEVYKPSLALPRMPLPDDRPVSSEVRVIIWGCRGLLADEDDDDDTEEIAAAADTVAPASLDVKVRVTLDCNLYKGKNPPSQETDVHYGSTNGNAAFNYRCVFGDIELPCKTAILTIAAIRFNPFGPEATIGQVNIELKAYLSQFTGNSGAQTEMLSYDVELKLTDQTSKVVGFVQTTIQFLPQTQADSKPVGMGQSHPNRDPVLTRPLAGRKWADFLGATGPSISFNHLWLQVRWLTAIVCFSTVFFIGCIKPGIFWNLN